MKHPLVFPINVLLALFFLINQGIHAAKKYVELHDEEVERFAGPYLSYYGEYAPRAVARNHMSFPVQRCDPLKVENFDTLQGFFTSAVEGRRPQNGKAIVLPSDKSLTTLRVVRARSPVNDCWAQVYFGYDRKTYAERGPDRIYQAHILAIQYKDRLQKPPAQTALFSGAQYLSDLVPSSSLSSSLCYWTKEENKLKNMLYPGPSSAKSQNPTGASRRS